MKKNNEDAERALVEFLDCIGELVLAKVGLQEEEEINQKLVGNLPALLALQEQEVRQEHAMGDQLEPAKGEFWNDKRLYHVESAAKLLQNRKGDEVDTI
mmetsp:Transcript_17518/g.50127  ORF Transcript_17518/g.50127 Transcript_17518/m.50127 type:complete len:99 (-) Transcript_17518:5486-5782(-)